MVPSRQAALLLLGLALAACATPSSVEAVDAQTFQASVGQSSSGASSGLWQGLSARAQAHCEQQGRTAIAVQERLLEAPARLALVFRCL